MSEMLSNVEAGPLLIDEMALVEIPLLGNGAFTALRKTFLPNWLDEEEMMLVNSKLLTGLLQLIASQIYVDKDWYLNKYSDVQDAIDAKRFRNAKHHYTKFGYFEDRLPHAIIVDQNYYQEHNRDIATGLLEGSIRSCQWHFEQYGFKVGRIPYKGWALVNNG